VCSCPVISKMNDDDFFCEDDGDTAPDSCSYGALKKSDEKANSEIFHNIGYVEAFESAKDVRLQQGFEQGYRVTIDKAQSMGKLLGTWAASQWFENHTNANTQQEDVTTRNVREEYDAAIVVRDFILQQQTLDTKTLDLHHNPDVSPFDKEMEHIECQLKTVMAANTRFVNDFNSTPEPIRIEGASPL
jgi:hypothetical protein